MVSAGAGGSVDGADGSFDADERKVTPPAHIDFTWQFSYIVAGPQIVYLE